VRKYLVTYNGHITLSNNTIYGNMNPKKVAAVFNDYQKQSREKKDGEKERE